MHRATRRVALIALSLILGACVGSGMMAKQQPVTKPDEALIVFLATDTVPAMTSVTLYDITDSEIKFIGVINPKTKVPYSVKPGTYAFMVLATSTDFLEATVTAGKRYFAIVSSDASSGTTTPRYRLRAVHQVERSNPEFESLERDTAYTAKTARADEWYANSKNAASVAARREKFFPQWFSRPQQERASQILRPEDGQ